MKVMKVRELERIASNLGFQPVRQRGSHVRWKHPDGRATTIIKENEIGDWLLQKILSELGANSNDRN